MSATTTQLLSNGEFYKLRYDTVPVKSASVNVSFYTSNSKMPNFWLLQSCRKWAIYIYSLKAWKADVFTNYSANRPIILEVLGGKTSRPEESLMSLHMKILKTHNWYSRNQCEAYFTRVWVTACDRYDSMYILSEW